MAAPRQLISDFALENPYYAGATVTVFTVDATLAPTTTKATLYAGPTGATTLLNPQVLDSRGKFPQPVYAGEPVSLSVLTARDAPNPLLLGVQGLVARWRGTWLTGTTYFAGERVRHPTLAGATFIVAESHTSAIFVSDVAAGRLVQELALEAVDGSVRCEPFGAVFDGVTDDGPAIQAAADYAAAQGRQLVIGPGTARSNQTITIPGGCPSVVMTGLLLSGVVGGAALVLGDGGTARNASRVYRGLRVQRATQSDWLDEAEIGIVARNMDAALIEVLQAEGFTIGLRTLGDARGFEDSTLMLGRIANNGIGLDIHCAQAGSWNNAVRYIGGHFANASGTNPALDRFGVRFSRGASGYNLHNHHVFYGPAFELQNQGGAVAAIPFLSEVNSRSVVAHQIRIEGNSPQVARHTAGATDHVYEVAFSSNGAITGTEGNAYLLEMDYAPGATRAGGSIVPLHQAAAAVHSPKLLAAVPSVRAAAFRWSSTEVGFEGLAVLSSNPAGPPTTLNGLAFGGLSNFTLNADSVTFPTSRALGFVVDCALCKEFFIAFEGQAMRVIAMVFDSGENVLGDAHVVLASNQTLQWQAGPQWWQTSADSQDGTYTRLQRVTVPASAQFAIIGVASSDPGSVLKALRLYGPAIHAPQVIAAGGRRWGTREFTGSAAWDPPNLAAGASASTDVAVANVLPGDFVEAGFSLATTMRLDADTPASGTIRARFTNITGSPIDVGAGTVFVRAVKPRL